MNYICSTIKLILTNTICPNNCSVLLFACSQHGRFLKSSEGFYQLYLPLVSPFSKNYEFILMREMTFSLWLKNLWINCCPPWVKSTLLNPETTRHMVTDTWHGPTGRAPYCSWTQINKREKNISHPVLPFSICCV